jgi:hypothetical protein
MDNARFSRLPWNRFSGFIDPDCDRFEHLVSLLEETGLFGSKKPPVVSLEGGKHIIVSAEQVNKQRTIFLIAHYDRTAGSPGANDNAAAVFILTAAAMKLRAEHTRDWLVIFTDKEELKPESHLKDQGAFTLARALKQAGFKNNLCFIFDTVGRGDTFIISTTAKHLLREAASWSAASLSMRRAIEDLNYRALEAARNVNLTRLLLLPTPFSDDAGFFLAGFPAQTITMLPADEAARFQSLIRAKPALLSGLISGTAPTGDDTWPHTWRLINSPADTAETLTPGYFSLIESFIHALCSR